MFHVAIALAISNTVSDPSSGKLGIKDFLDFVSLSNRMIWYVNSTIKNKY
jgi:hypothetical protein